MRQCGKTSYSRTRHSCQYDACVNMLDNQGCTHIHTQTKYAILIAFPRQQWLHERVSTLRYTYVHCQFCHCFWNVAVEWVELEFRNQKGQSSDIGPDTPLSSWRVFRLYHSSPLANTMTVLQIGHQRFPPPPRVLQSSLIIWSCII